MIPSTVFRIWPKTNCGFLLSRTRPLQGSRRFLATESQAGDHGKLIVNFSLPHETLLKNVPAGMVKIHCYEEDEMALYAKHAAFLYTLKPGMLQIEAEDKKLHEYFVCSGFAAMNPDSTLNIFATEACELSQINESAVAEALTQQKAIAEKGNSEESNDAKIRVEVYEAIMKSIGK